MIVILSKTSDECLKCPHYDHCDEKRMAACAVMELAKTPNNMAPAMAPNTAPIMMPIINNPKSVMITIEHQINVGDIERVITKGLRLGCHFRKGDA